LELARRLEAYRQTVNAIDYDKYNPMLPLAIGKTSEEVFQPERPKK
jgi:DNA-binding XRE family transcriptional regulator